MANDTERKAFDLAAIKARNERAHVEIGEICRRTGASRWRMSIPANPERDSDLILDRALRDAEDVIAEVERLNDERTYLVGPEECMDMECEDYFDDEGNDLEGVTQCSHVTEKQVTAEEHIAALDTQERIRRYAEQLSHSGDHVFAEAGTSLLILLGGGEPRA